MPGCCHTAAADLIGAAADLTGAAAAAACLLRLCNVQLAIEAGDESVYPGVVDMLSSQGRMKYLRPLYRCLSGSASWLAGRCWVFVRVEAARVCLALLS
jgi:hypothetical protein